MRFIFAASVALAIATPALADKIYAVTPSGSAETLFSDTPTSVIGKLSGKCIDSHWNVISSSGNELVCEAPLNFGQSVLGQALLGNSYSTPPKRFFRFNVAEVNGVSRVQASGWMETQMAFGQTRRSDFSGPEFENGIMPFMIAAGGQYPQGTTFPNHAFMGVATGPAAQANGIRVTGFQPGSPAETAGILPGDIIVGVAGKHFKTVGQLLDASAKAAESPSYEVDVLRDGKPLTFKVDREFRPAITGTVVAKADSAQPSAAPLGTADEIAKLAALRDRGLITPEEFDAKKKKLLGN